MFRRPRRDRKAAEPKTGDEGTLIDGRQLIQLLAKRSVTSSFNGPFFLPIGPKSDSNPPHVGSRNICGVATFAIIHVRRDAREYRVPISDELRDEYLEFECPNCSHVMVKKGSWFKVISNFNCDQCDAKIRLGYPIAHSDFVPNIPTL